MVYVYNLEDVPIIGGRRLHIISGNTVEQIRARPIPGPALRDGEMVFFLQNILFVRIVANVVAMLLPSVEGLAGTSGRSTRLMIQSRRMLVPARRLRLCYYGPTSDLSR